MQKHIRNIATITAILLCSAPAFAAQKSRATIQSDITTNLASGKPITAADLRAALADIADSAYITLTDTSTVGEGGTNITTYATGDMLYASATNTLSKLAGVATGNALISGGVTTAPSWGKIDLTTHISGVLPVANGGTNLGSYTSGDLLYATGTTTLAKRAIGSTGNVLTVVSGAPTWANIPQEYCYALSDQTTNLATGTAKITAYLPAAATVNSVRAYVNTAPTGATIIVDINEAGSTLMSTTKLSIDASEKTSGTAASTAALTDTSIAANAEITMDIDQVGSTLTGKGLVACINVTF